MLIKENFWISLEVLIAILLIIDIIIRLKHNPAPVKDEKYYPSLTELSKTSPQDMSKMSTIFMLPSEAKSLGVSYDHIDQLRDLVKKSTRFKHFFVKEGCPNDATLYRFLVARKGDQSLAEEMLYNCELVIQ